MENYNNCSVFLVSCRKSLCSQIFGFDDDTATFLAYVPERLSLQDSTFFLLEESDTEGLLPYEISEYLYTIKEDIIEGVKERGTVIVFGPKEVLEMLAVELSIPIPHGVEYATYGLATSKKILKTQPYLLVTGKTLYCWSYRELLNLMLAESSGENKKPCLN